jgi:hypothetical protein
MYYDVPTRYVRTGTMYYVPNRYGMYHGMYHRMYYSLRWRYIRCDGLLFTRFYRIFKTELRSSDTSHNSVYGRYQIEITNRDR